MEARAHLTNARIAPRKVQIVLDLIRGKDVETAMAILKYTPKSACEYLEKLLKSAVANAENNFGMNREAHHASFTWQSFPHQQENFQCYSRCSRKRISRKRR